MIKLKTVSRHWICDDGTELYVTRLSAFPLLLCGCFRSSITLIKPVDHLILIALLLIPYGDECSCSFIHRRTLHPPPHPPLQKKKATGSLMVGFHLKHLSACNTWQTGNGVAHAQFSLRLPYSLTGSWFPSRPSVRLLDRLTITCCVLFCWLVGNRRE